MGTFSNKPCYLSSPMMCVMPKTRTPYPFQSPAVWSVVVMEGRAGRAAAMVTAVVHLFATSEAVGNFMGPSVMVHRDARPQIPIPCSLESVILLGGSENICKSKDFFGKKIEWKKKKKKKKKK